MNVDVVVDVGNTRIKWGRCDAARVLASAALATDASADWQQQAEQWDLPAACHWAVTGVQPQHRDRLIAWIRMRGDHAVVIDNHQQLPLRLDVARPGQVGMDRLLNAVAVNQRRDPDRPAVVVDAGSAVTVDWIDAEGRFGGGAILPGIGMMLTALHEHTALLPLLNGQFIPPMYPGKDTIAAMQIGAVQAVAGAVHSIVAQQKKTTGATPMVFLTGGDATLLSTGLKLRPYAQQWPEMTLEGVRLAAAALPSAS